jgi:hypothetical protein
MNKSWFPPEKIPFERLNVTDGLLMNSQRWQLAHDYHRRRQNVLYQCLNEPGIVCGLQVDLIEAPDNIKDEYRDGRWLELQSGIAIDRFGNLIIVDKPINYRIQSEPQEEPVTIYLGVSYVDPVELHYQNFPETFREVYRIDEKLIANEKDVEICRIKLEGKNIQLRFPENIFAPQSNELDFRYRLIAKSRSPGQIRVAAYQGMGQLRGISRDEMPPSDLAYLLQSLSSLYPAIDCIDENQLTPLQLESIDAIASYDLIYLTADQLQALAELEFEVLKRYHQMGGAIAIEMRDTKTSFGEMEKVKQDLQKAIVAVSLLDNLADYENLLKNELAAISSKLATAIQPILDLCDRAFQTQLTPLTNLSNHPLQLHPFLFSACPTLDNELISIWVDRGIIVVMGNLSSAWGLNHLPPLPRDQIRTAQEMGINLLHFAWKRKQLTPVRETEKDLLQPSSIQATPADDARSSPFPFPISPSQKRKQSKPSDNLF